MGEVVEHIFGDGVEDGGGGFSEEDFARFPASDLGNAMRLILLAGGAVRRNGSVDSSRSTLLFQRGGGWVGFNGVYWDRNLGEELGRRLAHQVAHKVRSLYGWWVEHEGEPIPGMPRMTAKEFFKFADGTGSAGKTSAMLRQAQSYLMVEIDAFDRDPLALNCLNGTVKMAWDGRRLDVRLVDHSPADRITRCCSVAYDQAADCVLFKDVLETSLPKREERDFFHRTMGYGSTGNIREQAFFFVQGRGSDGKSTLLDACRETLGSYALAAAPETFLEGGMRSGADASPDLIALSGATRFAVLSEPPRGAKMKEGLLKGWTSGSPISARDLQSKPINFRPQAKLFFEMNSLVVARGDDDGLWRRLHLSLFRHQVPKAERDRELPTKLEPERPGILNWLIEGVRQWLERGSLDMPQALVDAVEGYRRASSPFGDWLTSRCVFGEDAKDAKSLASDLYGDFKAWAEDNGVDRVMSQTAFGNALSDRQILNAGKNRQGKKQRAPIRMKTASELMAETDAAQEFLAAEGVGDLEGYDDLAQLDMPSDPPPPESADD